MSRAVFSQLVSLIPAGVRFDLVEIAVGTGNVESRSRTPVGEHLRDNLHNQRIQVDDSQRALLRSGPGELDRLRVFLTAG